MATEKTFWKGSPDAFAAAFNPGVVIGAILFAASLHPAVTQAIGGFFDKLGFDETTARAVAYLPAAVLGFKVSWVYLSITTTVYVLTGDRLIIRKGLFVRVEDEVELYRVIDAIQSMNLFQRLVGVGSVTVTSTDKTGTVSMSSIRNSSRVRNGLRKLAERCKSRRGVRILE